ACVRRRCARAWTSSASSPKSPPRRSSRPLSLRRSRNGRRWFASPARRGNDGRGHAIFLKISENFRSGPRTCSGFRRHIPSSQSGQARGRQPKARKAGSPSSTRRGRRAMPIRQYLKGVDVTAFDPDAIRAMCDAFEGACRALQLTPDGEHVKRLLAKRIIALAACGERDPERLRTVALDGLGLGPVAAATSTGSSTSKPSYAPTAQLLSEPSYG